MAATWLIYILEFNDMEHLWIAEQQTSTTEHMHNKDAHILGINVPSMSLSINNDAHYF